MMKALKSGSYGPVGVSPLLTQRELADENEWVTIQRHHQRTVGSAI